jgi:pimeloyl-ACP methyl ester carboxylesterase
MAGQRIVARFRRQLEGLAEEFTVVAWDMPGCGESADPPEHFQVRDYVGCLATFIEALGLERPHVLGLSFGSGLALELYRAHPDLPQSLILASAYAGWAGSLPPDVAEARRQRMARMIELPPEAWAREWLPTLLTDSAPAEVVDALVAILSDFHPAGQRTPAALRLCRARCARGPAAHCGADAVGLWRQRQALSAQRGRGPARSHPWVTARRALGSRPHGRHGGTRPLQRRGAAVPALSPDLSRQQRSGRCSG